MTSAGTPTGAALREAIRRFVGRSARREPGDALAADVVSVLRSAVSSMLSADDHYLVRVSVGQGHQYAETPWAAVLDPEVTTSPQHGYYVAFLVSGNGTGMYLSLMQGTTDVSSEVGRGALLETLLSRAANAARQLAIQPSDHLVGPLELPGRGWRTRSYNAASICARWYPADALATRDLQPELAEYTALYRRLVDTKLLSGELSGESIPEGLESGRYRLITSPERNRSLAKKVKQHHGSSCQVCGFDFEVTYGAIGKGYIEAHHLTPMHAIKGRPTNLTVKDFAVLCANCHRMVHRQLPPIEPTDLRRITRTNERMT